MDVGGLEEAMHDALWVGGFEGLGDLSGAGERSVERDGAFERLAFDQVHD